jgi:hypothetical protein
MASKSCALPTGTGTGLICREEVMYVTPCIQIMALFVLHSAGPLVHVGSPGIALSRLPNACDFSLEVNQVQCLNMNFF